MSKKQEKKEKKEVLKSFHIAVQGNRPAVTIEAKNIIDALEKYNNLTNKS